MWRFFGFQHRTRTTPVAIVATPFDRYRCCTHTHAHICTWVFHTKLVFENTNRSICSARSLRRFGRKKYLVEIALKWFNFQKHVRGLLIRIATITSFHLICGSKNVANILSIILIVLPISSVDSCNHGSQRFNVCTGNFAFRTNIVWGIQSYESPFCVTILLHLSLMLIFTYFTGHLLTAKSKHLFIGRHQTVNNKSADCYFTSSSNCGLVSGSADCDMSPAKVIALRAQSIIDNGKRIYADGNLWNCGSGGHRLVPNDSPGRSSVWTWTTPIRLQRPDLPLLQQHTWRSA